MMAANYRHIGGHENRLGRHYSGFSAFLAATPLARQSLAAQKFPSGGSNRRSQVKPASAPQQVALNAVAQRIGCHTFGPTGVTAYLSNRGAIETRAGNGG